MQTDEGEKEEKKQKSFNKKQLSTEIQKTKIQIGTNLNSLFCFIASSSLRAQRQRGFLSETTKATLPRATP